MTLSQVVAVTPTGPLRANDNAKTARPTHPGSFIKVLATYQKWDPINALATLLSSLHFVLLLCVYSKYLMCKCICDFLDRYNFFC